MSTQQSVRKTRSSGKAVGVHTPYDARQLLQYVGFSRAIAASTQVLRSPACKGSAVSWAKVTACESAGLLQASTAGRSAGWLEGWLAACCVSSQSQTQLSLLACCAPTATLCGARLTSQASKPALLIPRSHSACLLTTLLCWQSHLDRVGSERCAFARVLVVRNRAMTTRQSLESIAQQWLQDADSLPPGNGPDQSYWEVSACAC